jgi:hypothetical protein
MSNSDQVLSKSAEGEAAPQARLPGLGDVGLSGESITKALPWALAAALASGGAGAWLTSREHARKGEAPKERNKRILRNALVTGLPVGAATALGIPAAESAMNLLKGPPDGPPTTAQKVVKSIMDGGGTTMGTALGATAGAGMGIRGMGAAAQEGVGKSLKKLMSNPQVAAVVNTLKSDTSNKLFTMPTAVKEMTGKGLLDDFIKAPDSKNLKALQKEKGALEAFLKNLEMRVMGPHPTKPNKTAWGGPTKPLAPVADTVSEVIAGHRTGPAGAGAAAKHFSKRVFGGAGVGAGVGFFGPPFLEALINATSSPSNFAYPKPLLQPR